MIRRVLLILLLCSPSWGAAAWVQDNITLGTGSAVSSVTVALTGTVAGNSLIVIGGFAHANADFNMCSDTLSSVYGMYVSEGQGGGSSSAICVASNIAGGNVTATCSSPSSYSFFSCYVAEYSGTVYPEAIAYFKSGNATSVSYTLTTNFANSMLITTTNWGGNSGTKTVGSGWTSHNTNGLAALGIENQLATTAGAYTVALSWSSTTTPDSVAIALKAGSAMLNAIGSTALGMIQPLVQVNQSAGSTTCAFPNNVVSGDILLSQVSAVSGTPTGISDTLGTSWVLVDSNTAQTPIKLWIGKASSSGADTITSTGTLTNETQVCVELLGSVVTNTVDAHTNGSYEGSPDVRTPLPLPTTMVDDVYLLFSTGNTNLSQCWPMAPLTYIETNNFCDATGYQTMGATGQAFNTFFNPGPTSTTSGAYIAIALQPPALSIVTTSLPTVQQNKSYTFPVYAVGGVSTYTWSISVGSLPTGLSINSSTGVISGTPTGGSSTFTVHATDGTSSANQSLTITVNSSASTPSFIQGLQDQLGVTLAFTSVSTNDVLWVAAATQQAGAIAAPTDSLGTVFQYVGSINTAGNVTDPAALCVYIGKATSSGADTVTFANGMFVPQGMQIRGVQPFFDTSVFTTGLENATSQTFTSTSLTTPTSNSMSLGAIQINPGTPASMTAQSPFTDAGSLLLDQHVTNQGYDLVASPGSSAFSTAIVGGTNPAAWNMAMTALRPTTSGAVVTSHGFPSVL